MYPNTGKKAGPATKINNLNIVGNFSSEENISLNLFVLSNIFL